MATDPTPFGGVKAASYTPGLNAHFQGGLTGTPDGSWEEFEREQGNYGPGSFEEMRDELTEGSDDV